MGIANIEWQISAKDERSGSQKSEDRSRESGVRSKKTGVGSQKSEEARWQIDPATPCDKEIPRSSLRGRQKPFFSRVVGQFEVEALRRPSADGRDKLASTSAKLTRYLFALELEAVKRTFCRSGKPPAFDLYPLAVIFSLQFSGLRFLPIAKGRGDTGTKVL